MGHLMLISEDVITAMARFPPDLRLIIIQYAPEPEWDNFVTGRYNETKKEDSRLLGGGKPVVRSSVTRNPAQWKVDEDDMGAETSAVKSPAGGDSDDVGGSVRGEFRRAASVGPSTPVSTADFGPADVGEDDEDDDNMSSSRAPHVCFFLLSTSNQNSDILANSLHGIWLKKWDQQTSLVHPLTKKMKTKDGLRSQLSV